MLRDLVDDGTTVILTTQYLEEADRLADDIVVLDHGRTVATARPTSSRRGSATTASTSPWPTRRRAASRPPVPSPRFVVRRTVDRRRPARRHRVRSRADVRLIDVVRALDDAGIDAVDVNRRQATLDDVFLTLDHVRPANTAGSPT